MEVNAKTVNLEYFYGHLHSLKALTDDRFWPYPRLDNIVNGGLLVDAQGNRFVDEGRGDVALANEVARSNDPTSYAMVFDQAAWDRSKDGQSKHPQPPNANPWLIEKDGDLHVRATEAELADALGVDRANLVRAVGAVNQAVQAGNAASLSIPRTGLTRPADGAVLRTESGAGHHGHDGRRADRWARTSAQRPGNPDRRAVRCGRRDRRVDGRAPRRLFRRSSASDGDGHPRGRERGPLLKTTRSESFDARGFASATL